MLQLARRRVQRRPPQCEQRFNLLPASEKRLQSLRGHREAALPGHSLVVYDQDLGLVCDGVACEDTHESERVGVQPLLVDSCGSPTDTSVPTPSCKASAKRGRA